MQVLQLRGNNTSDEKTRVTRIMAWDEVEEVTFKRCIAEEAYSAAALFATLLSWAFLGSLSYFLTFFGVLLSCSALLGLKIGRYGADLPL